MRGNITTKVPGKVYELRVSLGRDPTTGKYRQKSLTVHGTRAEAERALHTLVDEVEASRVHVRDPKLTFGALLDEWLTFIGGLGRSPTTIARYRGVIKHQIKPALGDVPLERLRTKAFDDLYRDLGRRLHPATVIKVHLVARAALARALKWGWIGLNPAENAVPPSARRAVVTTPVMVSASSRRRRRRSSRVACAFGVRRSWRRCRRGRRVWGGRCGGARDTIR